MRLVADLEQGTLNGKHTSFVASILELLNLGSDLSLGDFNVVLLGSIGGDKVEETVLLVQLEKDVRMTICEG